MREPHADFLLGRLEAVGAVDGVTADGDTVLTTEGSTGSIKRRGGTEHSTSLTDDIRTFPDLKQKLRLEKSPISHNQSRGEQKFIFYTP